MGRVLNKLSDAEVGSTIRFKYDGGTREGAFREVVVENVKRGGIFGCGGILGRDLTVPPNGGEYQYRQYKDNAASDIEVLREASEVEQEPTQHVAGNIKLEDIAPTAASPDNTVYGPQTDQINPTDFVPPTTKVEKSVPFSDYREQVKNALTKLPAEELAELAKKLGVSPTDSNITFDASAGNFVVEEEVPVPYTVFDIEHRSLTVFNSKGEKLVFFFNGRRSIDCIHSVGMRMYDLQPDAMAELIDKHVGS